MEQRKQNGRGIRTRAACVNSFQFWICESVLLSCHNDEGQELRFVEYHPVRSRRRTMFVKSAFTVLLHANFAMFRVGLDVLSAGKTRVASLDGSHSYSPFYTVTSAHCLVCLNVF